MPVTDAPALLNLGRLLALRSRRLHLKIVTAISQRRNELHLDIVTVRHLAGTQGSTPSKQSCVRRLRFRTVLMHQRCWQPAVSVCTSKAYFSLTHACNKHCWHCHLVSKIRFPGPITKLLNGPSKALIIALPTIWSTAWAYNYLCPPSYIYWQRVWQQSIISTPISAVMLETYGFWRYLPISGST